MKQVKLEDLEGKLHKFPQATQETYKSNRCLIQMLINNNKNHIAQYQTQCSHTEDVQIFSEGKKHKLEDTSFSQYSVHIYSATIQISMYLFAQNQKKNKIEKKKQS